MPTILTGAQVSPSGNQGPAGSVAVGTTTTVSPDTPASVVNVGTSTASILEFSIPQGIQGERGVVGPIGSLPVGMVVLWPNTTPPDGWLVCDGQLVARVTFPDLFALIGVTYGAGDGSTTFGLPDLRGRVAVGVGQGAGLTNRVIGAIGGAENHSITVAELAAHSHSATSTQPAHYHTTPDHFHAIGAGQGSHAHSISDGGHQHYNPAHNHVVSDHAHGISDPGHAHSAYYHEIFGGNTWGGGAGLSYRGQWGGTDARGTGIGIYGSGDFWGRDGYGATWGDVRGTGIGIYGNTLPAMTAHNADRVLNTDNKTPVITTSIANTGSGTAFSVMSPFLALQYIIHAVLDGAPGAPPDVPIADATQDGLLRQVSGLATDFIDGTNNCQDLATAIADLGISGGGPPPPIADTTQDGLLRRVSGLTTDFVDGSNNCQDLATAVAALGITGGAALPVGTIIGYPSLIAPPAWMVCDGSEISRATYPELFALMGTTYGAGDGSTTFNLPNRCGRVGIGTGLGNGLTDRVLGVMGGEENHVLTVAELATHTHIQDNHSHTLNLGALGWAAGGVTGVGNTSGEWGGTSWVTATNQNAGSSIAHNNMQPFIVLAYIIKVSADGGSTAQAPIADATQDGLLRKLSGLETDYVDGTNNCKDLNSHVTPLIALPPLLASETRNGTLKQVSGLTTDFIDGTNNCRDLAQAIADLGITAPPETETEYTLGHVAPQFFTPSGGYTFGIMFSVSVDGYLKEVSWYKTVDEASTVNHSFIIWDEANVPIWNSPPDNDPAVEGWITHKFVVPMPLSAGNYRLGIYAASGYGTADAYYPHVDGPLSSESGCYIEGNGCPINSSVAFYCFDLVFAVSGGEASSGIEEAPIDGLAYARQDAEWVETNLQGESVQILQSADEATAIADSTANPNNIYFWIVLPSPPVLTSLNPAQGGSIPNPATVQAIGSGFTPQCIGIKDNNPVTTTTFVSETELTLTFSYQGMYTHEICIKDQHEQKSNTISWFGGPM